ncbi:MAG: hypothetical protein IT371_31180 [Deltaproteobacteria bacterium]|nr:hypothetical protein [Deltaproteobacteria bacterium]
MRQRIGWLVVTSGTALALVGCGVGSEGAGGDPGAELLHVSSSRAAARPTPPSCPAGAICSPNWAGYVDYVRPGYESASGCFTVPTVDVARSKRGSIGMAWIGIGGYSLSGDRTLIQGGLVIQPSSSSPYQLFYETVTPDATQDSRGALVAPIASTIAAGDRICVSVFYYCTGPYGCGSCDSYFYPCPAPGAYWRVNIGHFAPDGRHIASTNLPNLRFDSGMGSAEFVVEAPILRRNRTYAELPQLGTVGFVPLPAFPAGSTMCPYQPTPPTAPCPAGGLVTSLDYAIPLTLFNPSLSLSAVPSSLSSAYNNRFNVCVGPTANPPSCAPPAP